MTSPLCGAIVIVFKKVDILVLLLFGPGGEDLAGMLQRLAEIDRAPDGFIGAVSSRDGLERHRQGLLHLCYEGGIEGSVKERPAVLMPSRYAE